MNTEVTVARGLDLLRELTDAGRIDLILHLPKGPWVEEAEGRGC